MDQPTSEDIKRQAKCDGKQQFRSAKIARRAARRKKGRVAYGCSICHYWHVGNSQFPTKKPMKELN
jgi:hypothetical protein